MKLKYYWGNKKKEKMANPETEIETGIYSARKRDEDTYTSGKVEGSEESGLETKKIFVIFLVSFFDNFFFLQTEDNRF